MNWQDIATLQQDGMDIESHTMDHKPLNTLSPWETLVGNAYPLGITTPTSLAYFA